MFGKGIAIRDRFSNLMMDYRDEIHAADEMESIAEIIGLEGPRTRQLMNDGLTIVNEYADEALSGRDDTRTQYQLLPSEIKTLKPTVLIL